MANTNISDRKVIDTGLSQSDTQDFRGAEIRIVGRDFEVVGTQPIEGSIDAPPESPDLGVPRSLQMERQEVRIQPDGSAVVDVVISFEVADNAAQHEVRLTKI